VGVEAMNQGQQKKPEITEEQDGKNDGQKEI
jgi:hypothetical protein